MVKHWMPVMEFKAYKPSQVLYTKQSLFTDTSMWEAFDEIIRPSGLQKPYTRKDGRGF
ncbi:hypothetical protein T265_15057, partial [Opisthorchis viverrini]